MALYSALKRIRNYAIVSQVCFQKFNLSKTNKHQLFQLCALHQQPFQSDAHSTYPHFLVFTSNSDDLNTILNHLAVMSASVLSYMPSYVADIAFSVRHFT